MANRVFLVDDDPTIDAKDIYTNGHSARMADAYDAMSSKRSYRNIMPQERIREEITNGSGTQFDPRFAEILLRMMDEDPDYNLREGGQD